METEKTESKEENPVLNLVERAEKAVQSMKEQSDRYEQLVKRNEEASARVILGGHSDAGQRRLTPEEEKQQEIKKVADEISNAFKRK